MSKPKATPTVYEILDLAGVIAKERGESRDSGGQRSMAHTVEAFNAITGHDFSETDGWVFLLVLKLGRAHVGGYHQDDWLDMPGYAALAAESALKTPPEVSR